MPQSSQERMARLVDQLQQTPGLAESLPSAEGEMVRAAINGQSVYEIAQDHRTSEETVWNALSNAARLATGNLPAHPIETGGFGSDTDPGVTGGYGATGFGDLSVDSGPDELDSEASPEFGGSADEQQP